MKAASLRYLLFAVLAAALGSCGSPPLQQEPELHLYGKGVKLLQVNCAARIGAIRPLIDTNRGPVNWPAPNAPTWDFSENFRQFGIEAIRSHDFYGPTDWWVIFPDFTAATTWAANYDFALSDERIGAIRNAGFECFYRLGTSWRGNNPLPINDPPGTIRDQGGQIVHEADRNDFQKWAQICSNIVRHYNQGWAGGHNYGIRYWEIWNEPDMSAEFWTGTPVQYYMLYEETAKALKDLGPKLKVGGPGLSGAFTDEYLDGLLRYCRKTSTPLDFYSWHCYGGRDDYNPYCYYEYGVKVREALNSYGYSQAESIVTEWNAGIHDEVFSDTPAGVAYYASSLMNMLNAGVTRAFQYVGDNHPMLGLHGHETGLPVRATQSLIAWKRMLETPLRVTAGGSDQHGYNILAGTNESSHRVHILISDYQSRHMGWDLRVTNLPWTDQTPYEATRWLLDPSRTQLEAVETVKGIGRDFVLKRNMGRRTICLIEIRRAWPKQQAEPHPRDLLPKRVRPRRAIRRPRRRPPLRKPPPARRPKHPLPPSKLR
ncbi:MAG: hypothetical protein QGH60_19950 [Phycisphaerae bacterium]|jgi:hypothetical protein|nr:hypothetical protein [Phycisphaerae bacterium]